MVEDQIKITKKALTTKRLFSEFDGIIPALKTAFTFKVKEKLNSFDDIKLIKEEKVEELVQNREINNDNLVLDDDDENVEDLISKDGDSQEKEPRILECLKKIKQKEKLIRVCIL